MGLSAVCDCSISRSRSFTIFDLNDFLVYIGYAKSLKDKCIAI